MQRFFAVTLAFHSLLSACGGGGRSGGADGPEPLVLAKLGLKIDAPAGSTASDGVVGGVLVELPDVHVTVDEVTPARPVAAEDAAREADMFNPANARTERLADGFAFMFENSGDLGKNYWVQVRREIGGTSYWCESTARSPELQATALAACKSLRR